MIVWSFGGGVQSTAIAVLVHEGALAKPDLVAIADTSRERGETWRYLRDVTEPYLAEIGVNIEVIPHSLAYADLYSKEGLTLMPAWTKEGRLPSFCSGRWKSEVMERWLRSKGVKKCINWIGFSFDELRRAGVAHREWCQPSYPLIEKKIGRYGCLRLIEAAGLPEPPRSRCWQCPHQKPEEWLEIMDNPLEWRMACEVDAEIRDSDEQHNVYLHFSRIPLAMVTRKQMEEDVKKVSDLPLFRPCQEAGCYT